MDLLLRRRMMMAAAEPKYIQNGLVLHLDGLNPGSADGSTWVDLVSGHIFTNHGAVMNSDSFSFDGTAWMENSSFTSPAPNYGTIEVVYDLDFTNYTRIFCPNGRTRLGLIHRNRLFAGFGNNYTYTGETGKGSISVQRYRAYENGQALTAGSTGGLTGEPSVNTISTSNGFEPVIGKIYAIRIYNRQLTEAEVMHNLSIDLARYDVLQND